LDRWHDDPELTYPRLRQFCEWWNAAAQIVTAGDMRHIGVEMCLH
jgi:hypothetical protein